jgi:predicted AAA+ superfamily ATPase
MEGEKFEKAFLEIFEKELSKDSPFYSEKIYITRLERGCLDRLVKCLDLARNNDAHISNILVGLKGVGKTTL